MSAVVTVRFFAAARHAAGVESEQWPAAGTVAALVGRLGEQRPELARVLLRCSYLLDEVSVRDADVTALPADATLDVLPPFAGG